jgi:hypothetical protein
MKIRIYVNHSKKAINIAAKYGWHPGARYTNLRDIKGSNFFNQGFIDIDWKNYDFEKHKDAVLSHKPYLTIGRDIESIFDLDKILEEASILKKFSKEVALVPKDERLEGRLTELIPQEFMLAYSVPTKYGGTKITFSSFDRPVHLLGGRPDIQRRIADQLNVVSIDCNRFTYDARFGDYFDGEIFRPHPKGGYANCLRDSIKNISFLWEGYNINDNQDTNREHVVING